MVNEGIYLKNYPEESFVLRGYEPKSNSGDPRAVSFAGSPFPLEEAERGFEKIKSAGRASAGRASAGRASIRLLISWEALEHGGPGIYDEEYLAYLRKLLIIAETQGIAVIMDPYQNAWSRFTGGAGAPAWTLEKAGMALGRGGEQDGALEKSFQAAALFTLFFGGNSYAPDFRIEGERAEDWLQERYIACMRHCFRRLKNCRAVTGWGVMNKASPGFIGRQELSARELSLFTEGGGGPWKEPPGKDHFRLYEGRDAGFWNDFFAPFARRFTERMEEAQRPVLFYAEGPLSAPSSV